MQSKIIEGIYTNYVNNKSKTTNFIFEIKKIKNENNLCLIINTDSVFSSDFFIKIDDLKTFYNIMKKKPGCGSKINSYLIAFKTMEISGQKELIIVHNLSSVIIGNHFDKWDIQFELEDILEFIKLNKKEIK